ncbi:MAG: hypothetical protein JWL63_2114 [Rhodocyclales bacterium]|nr:hypothetical protein [Rhodocyclales bacterium]
MNIKSPNKIVVALLLIIAAIAFSWFGKPEFSDFVLTDENGAVESVTMPFSKVSPNNSSVYRINGKIHLGSLSARSFRIIPDDEILTISVNRKGVDLGGIPPEALRDWGRGFIIDLGAHLHSGDNDIEIQLGDHGGNLGLKLGPSIEDARGAASIVLWAAAILLLLVWFAKRIRLAPAFYTAIVVGVVLRLVYLAVTNFETRTHDVGAHLEYIQYFVSNWSLPPLEYANGGGAWFHPPFYYFIGALLWAAVKLFSDSMQAIHTSLQIFSLVTSFGFLFYGLMTIQKAMDYFLTPELSLWRGRLVKVLFGLCGVLFACWPSGVLHSIRISNDSLLYLFFAGGLYYLTVWQISKRPMDFLIAMIFTALAVVSKANGVVLFAVAFAMLGTNWAAGGFKVSAKVLGRGAMLLIPPIIATAIAFYPGVALKLAGKRTHTYVNNMNIVGADQIVGNELQNLLWFDAKIFVTEPFTSPWDDKMGRQYFGNYLWKTGLFGEWRFDGSLARNSAVAISYSFLVLSLILLYGLYCMPLAALLRLSPLIYTGVLLVAAISEMRMTFPVNIDFRYILPIIICYSTLLAASLCGFLRENKNRLVVIGVATQLAFILGSIVFFCGVVNAN